MKTGKLLIAASALGSALAFSSCNTKPAEWDDEWVAQDIVAAPAAKDQIKIDGIISEGEWDDAQEYHPARARDWGYDGLLPRQRKQEDLVPFERGYFKVKYDDKYLYILASLQDSDIVQTSKEDQSLSLNTGDMIKIFLAPEGKRSYWEIRATPWNRTATLFYPWKGHSSTEQQKLEAGVQIGATIHGTINAGDDVDSGWDLEMAIPRELIEKAGETFEPGKEWKILLCRSNCGSNLPSPQISSTPPLPRPDHHLTEYYSKLKFKP